MSESTQEHGPTQHHQPEKAGNPSTKGFFAGNGKWYLVGGLGLIAVLVFLFVRQSNSNTAATSGTSASGTGTTSLDPTTEAMLQSALGAISSQGYSSNTTSTASPSGATTPTGGANTGPVTIGMPDGRLGWEQVTFPSVTAVGEWTAWNAGQTVPGTRSAWNAELQSLGATGWLPVVPYNPNAPLGTAGNTGNPLDTE